VVAHTSWLPVESAGATPFDRVFGLVPKARATYRDLDAALLDPAYGEPSLVALCRLRVDQLVGAESDPPGDLLGHEKVAALRSWPTSPLYDETDRAALNFAEKYVIDASSVDDEDCAGLRAHLSDPEVTTLVIAVAMADANARFRVALGV
jgi:hypothetical protein